MDTAGDTRASDASRRPTGTQSQLKCAPAPLGSLLWRVLVLALAVGAAPHGVVAQARSEPCPRPAPRSFPTGSVTVVDERDPPCRLVFRRTGVRLEAVADGSRPDPGNNVVRDGTGRYYSANARGFLTNISVWGPDGGFLTYFGRTGEGPGEFPGTGSILAIYMDGHDQLHVWAPGSWSVFSADHEFLRRYPTQANRLLNREPIAAVLDDGEVLTGSGRDSDGKNFFRIVHPDGTLLHSFGPVDPEIAWDEYQPPEKLISHDGGNTFWAAANRPLTDDWEGWVAEEWTLEGEFRRAVRRLVPGYEMFEANGNVSGATAFLHADDDAGLLYVVFGELTPRGRDRVKDPARITPEERRSGLFTARVEMLDLRSGELLASDVYPVEEAMTFLPRRLFRGTMEGYVHKETEAGLPVVEIVAIELVAK